jgi:prevent-host-death family protein
MISEETVEADKQLSAFLDRVEQGESVTTTRNGKAVARLVPTADDRRAASLAAFTRIRARRSLQNTSRDDHD